MAELEVYAEISRKMQNLLDNGSQNYTYRFDLPSGVDCSRKYGSRGCFFTCNDESAMEALTDLLDGSYINWQHNGGDDLLDGRPEKKEKSPWQKTQDNTPLKYYETSSIK